MSDPKNRTYANTNYNHKLSREDLFYKEFDNFLIFKSASILCHVWKHTGGVPFKSGYVVSNILTQ